MKLYELSEKYTALTCLLEEDGADEAGLKGQLALIEQEFKDKAENIGKIILSQTAEVKTLEAEIDRLTTRKSSLTAKTDWLKDYLLTEMLASGQDKIKGTVVTLSIRNNPVSVNVISLMDIPEEYRRVIPEHFEADKTLILQTVKLTGEVIPGVEIITGKKSLSVK